MSCITNIGNPDRANTAKPSQGTIGGEGVVGGDGGTAAVAMICSNNASIFYSGCSFWRRKADDTLQ